MTPNEFVKHCQWLGQQDGPVDYKAIVLDIMDKAMEVDTSFHPCPDYLETHYVISVFIDKHQDEIQSLLDVQFDSGTGGLWDKAESLTNEFQSKYDGTAWGEELDWHDTLDEFLKEKLQ